MMNPSEFSQAWTEKAIVRLPGTTVIVPTYNEADNIERLVKSILSISQGLRLLVIDDNSPDGTGDIARRMARSEKRLDVVTRPGRMGLGSAYREGFLGELERGGSEYLMEIDADFSHDPAAISGLIQAAEEQGADLVIGSRYVPGGRIRGWNWKRLFLSSTANRLCSLMIARKVRDYTAGFRCYRAEALRAMDIGTVNSDGYAFQVEMTWRVLAGGMKVVEVPIEFSERSTGDSKFGAGILLEAALLLGLLFFKRLVV